MTLMGGQNPTSEAMRCSVPENARFCTSNGRAMSAALSPFVSGTPDRVLRLTPLGLRFQDEADGAIAIFDAASGREVSRVPPRTNGFIRGVLRGLYAERFGQAALDKQKKAAEGGAVAPAAAASMPSTQTEAAQAKLALWQRVGKVIQGEPQVADASAFYNQLQAGLNQNQPLATDVLVKLGAQRAEAILAALQEAGVDPARAVAAAPEKVESDVGKPVPLKLGLAAK